MNVNYTLKPDAVATIKAASKRDIFEQLAVRFEQVYGLDRTTVLERLEEREKLGSTGFGRGVAIPHARVSGTRRPVAVLLRLREPVDFAAADGMPVDIVFGLVSPENSGVAHLHALASISRAVREERIHEALLDARDDETLYALLCNAADRSAA